MVKVNVGPADLSGLSPGEEGLKLRVETGRIFFAGVDIALPR